MADQTPFNADNANESSTGPGGTNVLPFRPLRVWARLTVGGAPGLYSWVEVERSDSDPSGWAATAGGRSGVHDGDDSARERNLASVYADPADGTVVQLQPDEANPGRWIFDAPGGATPPAGQRFARVTVPAGPVPGGPGCLESVTDCSLCPGGAPPSWTFAAAGGSGDFAGIAGAWLLTHAAGCVWSGTLGAWSATLTLTAGVTATLVLSGPAGASLTYVKVPVPCGGPLALVLVPGDTIGTGSLPGLTSLFASCYGAPCTQGEGVLVTPAAGACGWDGGAAVVLEPLDASKSLTAGHVYPVWLKTPATGGDPAVYLAGSEEVNYYEAVTVTYVSTEIDYYDSTVNYYQTVVNLTDVTINVLSPTYVYGPSTLYVYAPLFVGYGLDVCGWVWFCGEEHVLWHVDNVLDLSEGGAVPPHAVALLAAGGPVTLDAFFPVAPPVDGGQYVWAQNSAAGPITLGGGFLVPGPSGLPVTLQLHDSFQSWYDEAVGFWRVMSLTYGDFRFADSSPQTLALWDENREANFLAAGGEGDFLRSRLDAVTGRQTPTWEPAAAVTPDWSIDRYRTDCVSGVNVRYVRVSTMTAGVFDPGEWVFDSLQGCCDCPPAACCNSDRFCFIVPEAPAACTQFGGKYVVFESDTPCVYTGVNANGVTATLDMTAQPDATLVLTDGVTTVYYEALGTLPCPGGVVSWASTSESSPCVGDTWPAGFPVEPGDACTGTPIEPPPGCCADVPASVTITGLGTYPLSPVPGVLCLYYYVDGIISIVVDVAGAGGVATVVLHGVSPGCRFTRASGCLGAYDEDGGDCGALPPTITVS